MPRFFHDLGEARVAHENDGGYLLDLGSNPAFAAREPVQGAVGFTRYSDTGSFGTVWQRTWGVMDEGETLDHRTPEQLAALVPTYAEA
jgi:hypothetical protein